MLTMTKSFARKLVHIGIVDKEEVEKEARAIQKLDIQMRSKL